MFRIVPGELPEKVVSVSKQPSGLGWLPNGDLLISSMLDKTLYRWSETQELNKYADVSAIVERRINDMHVDHCGRAWVGYFGLVHQDGESIAPGTLARVDRDQSVHAAAGYLHFANGMVLVNGGNTLFVAGTYRGCLTAFDITSAGDLINRRLWAQLPEGDTPDGICVDADEAIWVASPATGSVLRLLEGGEVTDSIRTGRKAIACALGGNDGRTLFVSTSSSTDRHICLKRRTAAIHAFNVPIPSA